MKKFYSLLVLICTIHGIAQAQNTPCTAVPLPNNMNGFQTFSTAGLNNSGVPYPGCGGNVGVDIWFSVVAPPSGDVFVAIQAGTMLNAAMAFYQGPCNNLSLQHCAADANCGPPLLMPAMQKENLIPGQTYFIRIWPEGPGGTFQIRVTDGDPIQATLDMLPVGSAVPLSPYCMRLTDPVPAQAGCAWNPDQINFTQPFTRELLFNFGNNVAGADGICMVFQNSPAGLSACGIGGGGIAADGITNSFIIEFDTWDNGPAFADIPADHTAINVNGNMLAPIAGPVQLLGGNIEDGMDHLITFTWNPAGNLYTLSFDGVQVLNGTYNIIANCFGGNPMAYFGVTASTGGAVNLQTVCTPEPPLFPAGSRDTVYAEICQGETYFAGGGNQAAPGIYNDNLPAYNGCDSTIVTFLSVIPQSFTAQNTFVCAGECVTIGNSTYCTSGTHTTTLSNYQGCDSTVVLNLIVLDPQINIVASGPINCTNPIITLDATGSTPGPGMTFLWTGPGGGCIAGTPNSPLIGASCPGDYTLTLTHQASGVSCSVTETITVTLEIEDIQVSIAEPVLLSCIQSCTQLNSEGSPTGSQYQYAWVGPNGFTSNLPNPEVCETGDYTLTITNTLNGCSDSETVTVFGNTAVPVADAGPDAVLNCNATIIDLDAGGSSGSNLVVYWYEGGVLLDSVNVLQVDQPGSYSIVVIDTLSGCTDSDTVLVTDNFDTPLADAGLDQVLDCTQSSVDLNGSGSSSGSNIQYSWQNSAEELLGTAIIQTVTEADTYTLIVTNTESGCSDTSQVDVIQDLNAPVADPGPDQLLNCNELVVVLDASGSSQGSDFTYTWLDENGNVLGTDQLLSVDIPGSISLVVSNIVNNCVDTAMVQIGIDTLPPVASAGDDGVLSCSSPSWLMGDSLVLNPGNWTFAWINEAGQTISQNQLHQTSVPGVYTLLVQNTANGCSSQDSVLIVADDDVPSADPGIAGTLTCTQTDWLLGGPGSSSGPFIEYSWLDESGTQLSTEATFLADSAGMYTLEVLNTDNGCISTASVEVDQDTEEPGAEAGPDLTLSCGQPNLTLTANGLNPGTLEFSWTDEQGILLQQGANFLIDQPGLYLLSVLNTDNGCSSQDSVLIDADFEQPIADAGNDQEINCQIVQVSLDGSNSSAGAEFQYIWSDSLGNFMGDQPFLNVSDGGVYVLSVVNSENGCVETDTVVVQADYDGPVADAGPDFTLTCTQPQNTLDGSNSSAGPDITYQWLDENNSILSNQLTLLVNSQGTYTLLVSNTENGCSDSQSVSIAVDTLSPLADPGTGGTLTCDVLSIQLGGNSASGPDISYFWTDDFGTLIDTLATTPVNEPGLYTLQLVNAANGCTQTATVLVEEDITTPTAIPGTDTLLNCYQPDIVLDGSNSSNGPQFSYSWTDALGSVLGTNTSVSVNAAGTYTLSVLNTENGCSDAHSLTVDADFDAPTASANTPVQINCFQPNAVLDGTASSQGAAFSYTWTQNGAVLGNSATLPIDVAGTFEFQVLNQVNGCESSSSVEVLADFQTPVAAAGLDLLLNCYNDQGVLNGSASSSGPNFTYNWSDSGGNTLGTNTTLSVASQGTYTLSITNTQNGCTSSDQAVVTEDFELPILQTTTPNTLTCNELSVDLNGTGSSTGAGFVTAWFDEQNNLVSNQLLTQTSAAGEYTLIITNIDNGCTSSESIEVQVNQTPPEAVLQSSDLLTCIQLSANLNAAGSSEGPSIDYFWNTVNGGVIQPGGSPLSASVTSPGNYAFIVLDVDNGCADTAVVEILQDLTPPVADAGNDATLTCFDPTISLNGLGSQPAGLLQYSWSTGNGEIVGASNIATPTAASAGVYTLTVTNTQNGCTDTDFVQLAANFMESLEVSVTAPNCPGDLGALSIVNVSGGAPPYLYSINGGQSFGISDQFQALNPGNYEVVVQDADGCTLSETTVVLSPPDLQINLAANIELLLGESIVLDAQVNVFPSDLQSVQWFPSTGLSCDTCLRPSLQPTESGLYTLQVVHLNGCDAEARIQVLVDRRSRVYAPNVFSPNDDGFNDIFMLFAAEGNVRSIRSMSVYSRWGEQVFSATNIQPNDPYVGWDGRFRGERLDPAVFIWMAEVELLDGHIELFRGDVTLVR